MRTLALAILAGAFIALGAAFYTLVTFDSGDMPAGLMKMLGGLSFCLGLILVVVAGAELFTGNNLIVMAYVDKQVTLKQLLKNWSIVYIGNFIGALGILVFIVLSGHWQTADGHLAEKVVAIASGKVSLSWSEAFFRGVLCNILVCLAVWLCFAGRTVVDKVLAILFPVTAFVAMGFEHCVANMYFIPAGIMAQTAEMASTSSLNWISFFSQNLLPVTLGNMLGGSVFVGLFYWFIYLRQEEL
jgi:formate/nitrite transporter